MNERTLPQPLTETATNLVFITEAVMCSLGNALGLYENLRTLPLALKELELGDLDKQIGLLQLSDALGFCHKSAKLVQGMAPHC